MSASSQLLIPGLTPVSLVDSKSGFEIVMKIGAMPYIHHIIQTLFLRKR
jgi:hypothetical protein